MATQQKSVSLDRSMLDALVTEIEGIVTKVKAASGTASARKNKATLEALNVEVKFVAPKFSGKTLGDVAEWLVAAEAEAEQLADEQVTAILKGTSGPDVSGLKETYAAKKDQATAMLTMLSQFGIDCSDVVIPALRSGGGGGSRPVGSKTLRFYGPTGDMADSQNKFSSLAWYHGAKIMGTEDRPSSDALLAHLKSKGVDVDPRTHAWELDGYGARETGVADGGASTTESE